MNRFYIAVTIEENKKFYSYVLSVTDADNLICKLEIKNIVAANICKTKKYAKELVNYWNACYKANKTFLFNDPIF